MLEVIVVEKGEARDVVLDALRAKGYHVSTGSVGGASVNVAQDGPSATPAEIVARSVEVLEGEFDEAEDPTTLYRFVLQAVEKRLIENALERNRGNQLAAARLLGINRNTLRSRIRRLGIRLHRGQDALEGARHGAKVRLRQTPRPAEAPDAQSVDGEEGAREAQT